MEELPNTQISTPAPTLHRRSALRLLTLTGLGLFAGTSKSEAFMGFFRSYDPVSPKDIRAMQLPPDWLKSLGPTLPSYAQFIDKMKLRNITIHDVIRPHTNVRKSVQNSLPPRAMWNNIRSTLKVIDSLADRLDLKVADMISVYRSPAYNAKCPGAKTSSLHMRNNAVDVVFNCPPGKVAAMARAMRATGLFKGGVGRYSGFTHLDTRGDNADW